MHSLQTASLAFYLGFRQRPTESALDTLRGLSEVLREVTREAASARRPAAGGIPIVQVDAEGQFVRLSL